MNLCKKGIDAIIDWESGGVSEYNRHPEWPGNAANDNDPSGITIGIGWDLGQTPANETSRAWKPHLSVDDLAKLISVSGIKGKQARLLLPSVRHIEISWDKASRVFDDVTLPTWYIRALRIYPQIETIPTLCAAALIGLVFNRGTSLEGSTRTEMKEIQSALKAGDLEKIPDLLVKMKRLWPNFDGLKNRRDKEANLFREGLTNK